ncbi:MAG: hypothetical protein AB8B80_07095 [Marinicellaceae bacterium]
MAFIFSVVILSLILLIPINISYDFAFKDKVIEVVINKSNTKKPPKPQSVLPVQDQHTTPQSIKPAIAEPLIVEKTAPNENVEKVIDNKPSVVAPIIQRKIVKEPTKKPIQKLPSAAVIFNSAYGKVKLYELDEAFKARKGDEDNFKFREIKQPEWNTVIHLIDEEVDKPRVEMNFYSEGIVGSTERFFDKISYKKVFTTRYGTKIACGGVGPLVACSWK